MKKRATTGYSLIEVLVAVSILMLSIVGPITIAAKGLQSAQFVRQQDTAFFLAQEGISLVSTIRNDTALQVYKTKSGDPWSWTVLPSLSSCFKATGCDIDASSNAPQNNVVDCSTSATACNLKFAESAARAKYQQVSGTPTLYKRTITLTRKGANEVIVQSTVDWQSTLLGGTQSVTLQTSLFNLYKDINK